MRFPFIEFHLIKLCRLRWPFAYSFGPLRAVCDFRKCTGTHSRDDIVVASRYLFSPTGCSHWCAAIYKCIVHSLHPSDTTNWSTECPRNGHLSHLYIWTQFDRCIVATTRRLSDSTDLKLTNKIKREKKEKSKTVDDLLFLLTLTINIVFIFYFIFWCVPIWFDFFTTFFLFKSSAFFASGIVCNRQQHSPGIQSW